MQSCETIKIYLKYSPKKCVYSWRAVRLERGRRSASDAKTSLEKTLREIFIQVNIIVMSIVKFFKKSFELAIHKS